MLQKGVRDALPLIVGLFACTAVSSWGQNRDYSHWILQSETVTRQYFGGDSDCYFVFELKPNKRKPTVRLGSFRHYLQAIQEELVRKYPDQWQVYPWFNDPRQFYGKSLFPKVLYFLRPADLSLLRNRLDERSLIDSISRMNAFQTIWSNLILFPLPSSLINRRLRLDPLGILATIHAALGDRLTDYHLNFSEGLAKSYGKDLYLLKGVCSDNPDDDPVIDQNDLIKKLLSDNITLPQHLDLLEFNLLKPESIAKRSRLVWPARAFFLGIVVITGAFFIRRRFVLGSCFLGAVALIVIGYPPARGLIETIFSGNTSLLRKTYEIERIIAGRLTPFHLVHRIEDQEQGLELAEEIETKLRSIRDDDLLASYALPTFIVPSKRRNLEISSLLPTRSLGKLRDRVMEILENSGKDDPLDFESKITMIMTFEALEKMFSDQGFYLNERNVPSLSYEQILSLSPFFRKKSGELFLVLPIYPRNRTITPESIANTIGAALP